MHLSQGARWTKQGAGHGLQLLVPQLWVARSRTHGACGPDLVPEKASVNLSFLTWDGSLIPDCKLCQAPTPFRSFVPFTDNQSLVFLPPLQCIHLPEHHSSAFCLFGSFFIFYFFCRGITSACGVGFCWSALGGCCCCPQPQIIPAARSKHGPINRAQGRGKPAAEWQASVLHTTDSPPLALCKGPVHRPLTHTKRKNALQKTRASPRCDLSYRSYLSSLFGRAGH